MSEKEEEKKNKTDPDLTQLFEQDEKGDQSGESGESGGGGIGGKVHFRYKDPASSLPRDDALPATEIKRLLIIQSELHKTRVDKQKQIRKERQEVKSGRKHIHRSDYSRRHGAGRYSSYKKHPISNKAQFSGMDRQMSAIPSENIAETNAEQRQEKG